jgi:hypothetical protein
MAFKPIRNSKSCPPIHNQPPFSWNALIELSLMFYLTGFSKSVYDKFRKTPAVWLKPYGKTTENRISWRILSCDESRQPSRGYISDRQSTSPIFQAIAVDNQSSNP